MGSSYKIEGSTLKRLSYGCNISESNEKDNKRRNKAKISCDATSAR